MYQLVNANVNVYVNFITDVCWILHEGCLSVLTNLNGRDNMWEGKVDKYFKY